MDSFHLVLDGLCLAGQGVIHMVFVSRFTGKKHQLWRFAAYLFTLLTAAGIGADAGSFARYEREGDMIWTASICFWTVFVLQDRV